MDLESSVIHYALFHPVSFAIATLLFTYAVYRCVAQTDPLLLLPSPPNARLLGGHVPDVVNPSLSYRAQDEWVKKYGRNIRVQGMHPWEHRLLPLDPVSLGHVLRNYAIYQKPWQSRHQISSLVGCGMFAAESETYSRHRRVATPAFSWRNLRALIPLVFNKGEELKDKWKEMMEQQVAESGRKSGMSLKLDVCHWVSRATFDVVGLAAFDYQFNAVQDESNELLCAYKDMFETAVAQSTSVQALISVYFPLWAKIFPSKGSEAILRGQETIRRVASKLVQQKKAWILAGGEETDKLHGGKDLLSLMLKSNLATDVPESERLSDEDILNNVNTFMFAGTDTISLAVTWTLFLLAKHPDIQTRLRAELRATPPPDRTSDDSVHAHYNELASLPFLNNVCRESLRLMPPIHSSMRTATEDDVIPTSTPVVGTDGIARDSFAIRKGTLVHVPMEGMNLDKELWGDDAWQFIPDRWDHLPKTVASVPGSYSSLLTFSAGGRACIGQRFSLIEMKTFLHTLITNFVFSEADEKVVKANVLMTRPYVSGRFKEGSQCPMIVTQYVPGESD
ncbi:cytochrome P450 [Artomyces pyxidatus]|uniref:Cytochrome P450 n=1 Tax=Artomyces pyxidatus TaxID=48021 RepID=A0ACB8T2E7_9AGAM|nr:cytochrome P450 [Artomyces pyxidatus]